MATTPAERLFCDTNVLLHAVDRKRALHAQALHVLDELPNQGVELCVSGQILRELVAVCTRPREVNGLGLTVSQAVENAEAVAARSTILDETREVAARLLRMVAACGCSGKQVHDANLVATMLEHRIGHLVTAARNGVDSMSAQRSLGWVGQ